MRASRSPRRTARGRGAPAPAQDHGRRADAEQRIAGELAAWRARAVPDADAPLETDDLARLFRDLVATLGLDPAVAAGFTINTVHYYRRKDIIDPPEGRTTAARYSVRHLWQVAGARLAGHLGLVTLSEARVAMRDADAAALIAFLAARVADARARELVRRLPDAPPVDGHPVAPTERPRPLPGRRPDGGETAPARAMTIALPGGALCVIPDSHAALRSPHAARQLAGALAAALGTTTRP